MSITSSYLHGLSLSSSILKNSISDFLSPVSNKIIAAIIFNILSYVIDKLGIELGRTIMKTRY